MFKALKWLKTKKLVNGRKSEKFVPSQNLNDLSWIREIWYVEIFWQTEIWACRIVINGWKKYKWQEPMWKNINDLDKNCEILVYG